MAGEGTQTLVRMTPEVERAIRDSVKEAVQAAITQTLPPAVTAVTSALQASLSETIRQAVAMKHECVFDLPPEWQGEIGHLVGMVVDMGGGDLRRGIERLREHHLWLKWRTDPERAEEFKVNHETVQAARKNARTWRGVVVVAALTILTGAVLSGLWEFLHYLTLKLHTVQNVIPPAVPGQGGTP